MSLQTIRKAWAGSVSRRRVVAAIAALLFTTNSHAQIVTDGTMGAAGALAGPNFVIPNTLGTQVGGNLFHSFSDFNIQDTESATFTSNFAGTTDNIISRVTGLNPSNINGKLASTIPGADLWLMNPNGVFFGAGASLDLPAGLHVTTADYLTLGEGGRFDSQANLASTVLTAASPTAFGYLSNSVGGLTVKGATLTHKGISLVGSQIELNSSVIEPVEGHINTGGRANVYIASVSGAGEIGTDLQLKETNTHPSFGPLSLSALHMIIDPESSIRIFAGDMTMATSTIAQKFVSDAGSAGAGTLSFYVDSLKLVNDSNIFADNFLVGESCFPCVSIGDILIAGNRSTTKQVAKGSNITVEKGSNIFTATSEGKTGSNITLNTNTLNVDGKVEARFAPAAALARSGTITLNIESGFITGSVNTEINESGDASRSGDINIFGKSLELDGGKVLAGGKKNSAGSAGNIKIEVDDLTLMNNSEISMAGNLGAGIFSIGITINVDTLRVLDSAISAETFEVGDTFIMISASDYVELVDGRISASNVPPEFLGIGNAVPSPDNGTFVQLDVGELRLIGMSEISAATSGRSDSGNILIQGFESRENAPVSADLIYIDKESAITTSTTGPDEDPLYDIFDPPIPPGDAGTIEIFTKSIQSKGIVSSSATNLAKAGSILVMKNDVLALDGGTISVQSNTGTAGNITIDTNTLGMDSGAQISATSKNSAAGFILINAVDGIQLDDSSILASTNASTSDALANAAFIGLNTPELILLNGSTIAAETTGALGSGSISISGLAAGGTDRANIVEVGTNSTISTSAKSTSTGNAGDITLYAEELDLDGAITSTSAGSGDAGRITVDAGQIQLDGDITTASSGSGEAGSVTIKGGSLTGSGIISSDASGSGNSGTVTFAMDELAFSGPGAGITVSSSSGKAGDITLDVNALRVDNGAVILAETTGALGSGTIAISGLAAGGTDRATIVEVGANSSISTSSTGASSTGNAGDITLYAEELDVDGTIASTSEGSGDAGTIIVDAGQTQLDGAITTAALNPDEAGTAGDVTVTGGTLTGRGIISSDAKGSGEGGSVSLTLDQVTFSGKDAGITVISNTGTAGDITVDVNSLLMDSGAVISAESTNAQAGSILIAADDSIQLDASRISASTAAPSLGTGGNAAAQIKLDTSRLTLRNESEIAAETTGALDSGNILISGADADDSTDRAQLVDVGTGSSISTSAGANSSGTAGNISLYTEELALDGTIASTSEGSGDAGTIIVDAGQTQLDGAITTAALNPDEAGTAGDVTITGGKLTGGGIISSNAEGAGEGGSVALTLGQVTFSGKDAGITVTSNTGTAGDITVDVNTLLMDNEAVISAESTNAAAGSIRITARERMQLDDSDITATTRATSAAGAITALAAGDSDTAEIRLNTPELLLLNDSTIAAETTGVLESGNIIISGTGDADDGTDRAQLVDVAADSTISTSARADSSGNAGNISLYTEELDLDGTIASSSDGSGNAGDIELIAGNSTITGTVSTSSTGEGNGGSIGLEGETLFLGTPGLISSSAESTGAAGNIVITVDQAQLSGGAISVASNEGTAGFIEMYLKTLLMDQGALISAESKNSTGGSVRITATDLIQMTDSTIKASAQGTATGDGGGNITIDGAPDYLIMDRSLISANANAGAGGNIAINTDTLVKSADSYITATSQSSVNGTVNLDVINSLTQNVIEVEVPDLALPDPLDQRCTPADVQTRSSLRVDLVAPGAVESAYLGDDQTNEWQPQALAMGDCS